MHGDGVSRLRTGVPRRLTYAEGTRHPHFWLTGRPSR